jgi:hypothetical protein
MAICWSGNLFAFPQEDGSHLVSITLPPGLHAEDSVLVFDLSGPLPPEGFHAMLRVEKLDAWMRQKSSEGYTFQRTTMRNL